MGSNWNMLDPNAYSDLFNYFYSILEILTVIAVVVLVLQIIAMWKVFTKAGESGWKSLIPIYNVIIYYKISGVSPWLYLIVIIAGALTGLENDMINALSLIVTIIITLYQTHSLAKAFGKGIGYTLGLLFLNTIFLYILGFGSSKYELKQN